MRKHRICAGFTLIELLVTVAVLGILATIAYPSLQNLLRDSRVVSQANELASIVTYAHSQATQGVPEIVLVLTQGANWSATLTGPEGPLRTIAPTNTLLRATHLPDNGTDPVTVRINNRGIVTTGPASFRLEHTNCSGTRQARAINIRLSGQINIEPAGCGE